MSSLRANPEKLEQIRDAYNRKKSQGAWKNIPDLLDLVAKKLPKVPIKNPKSNAQKNQDNSLTKRVWQKFRRGEAIMAINFHAFCEVLELNKYEIIDPDLLYLILPNYSYQSQSLTLRELRATKRYDSLIGRDKHLLEIQDILTNKDINKIIAIQGIGGCGKTALALESIIQVNNIFKDLIWLSAKPEVIVGSKKVSITPASITFSSVLDEIGIKLGKSSEIGARKDIEEKKRFIKNSLAEDNYILVIDNLETVESYQDLVTNLEGFFDTSKVIITSRKIISGSPYVHGISLGGLEEKDTYILIKNLLRYNPTASEKINNMSQQELIFKDIYQITGGLPLAIELIIGQIESGLIFESIFERLRSINYTNLINSNISDEDIFEQFYKFIYEASWNELSLEEQHFLIQIGACPLSEGLLVEDIIEENPKNIQNISHIISKLTKLSLIKNICEDNSQVLKLHPLTYQFVKEIN